MSTWRETVISDRIVLMANTELFSVSFFRQPDNTGWAGVSIIDDDTVKFDEYRSPVLMVRNEICDLAHSKSLDDLRQRYDPDQPPAYMSDPTIVMAQIWHGKPNEGLGFFGRLLESSELVVVVYQSDYDIQRTTFPLDDPALFRRVLRI